MSLSVTPVDHPLVHHHLARLRSCETRPAEFRQLVRNLAVLMALDATADLPLVERSVTTPLCETTGRVLRQRIALVPILRAGLGMVDPLLDLIPEAEVWHLGIYRREDTAEPVEYYNKLPVDRATDIALILDPMLATGGSARRTCQILLDWGVQQVKLLALIAAPEGIESLQRDFPELDIFVCAIDERLDENKFIVPGLGDAGDRIFKTEVDG